jgi:hypothetical protein
MQPSSAPWVSETVPDTLPLFTVNPVALLLQSLNFAVIVVTVVPAGSLEVSAGLNIAEPLTLLQETVLLVALTAGGAPALALPPVTAMRPSGVAIAALKNNSFRIMLCSFSRRTARVRLMTTSEMFKRLNGMPTPRIRERSP